jgi:serine/threonine-protein kinase
VLPFANESADTADAYLGVGIAEELLGALADVPGLRVASQTSSVAQGGRGRDPRALGRALGVASVLEGSVRRRGGTVRVAARLVDARADSLLWHDSFDRPAAAMFDVQEEIARAIVERLRVRLGAATPAIVRRRTPNPVAHDLVLRVAALRNDSGSLVSAVGMLNRAIALDSTYAEAWAHLARVYQALAVFDDQTRLADEPGMTAGELLRRARRAAQRAVVLDPRSATAHSALGALLFRYDWDWAGAERELSRAIQLNPTAPEPHQTYHRFLRSMGRFEEARRELALAMRYAASRRSRGQNVGRISFFEHDFERAIRETLTDPDTTSRVMFTWLGQAYIGARRFAEAESALVRGSRGDAPANLLMRGLVYARTGRPALAREILHRVPGTENDLPTHVAAVLLALGDTAAAASEIKRAVDTKDPLVVDLKVDPWIAPLRDDPRFRPIYDRLRFP